MIVPGQIDVLTSSTFDSFRTFALFPCQESRMMVPPCHIMPYHPSRQPWGSPSHRMSRWGLSVPIVLFLGSDGLRSPRHLRVSFHIMVTSLQRVWSVADFSTDVRATLGSSSCFSAEPLGGGWGGGGGVRVSGGWGGCNNVLSTTFLTVFVILHHPTSNIQHALDATLWHFFVQHLTCSWCYAVALLRATPNMLLMLRCGTSSCNI